MDLKTIRFIDNYIGGVLCRLASNYKNLKGKTIQKKAINKILIVKMWGIGSIILASPTIRAVRRRYPDAAISFLTLSANKGVYEGSELIDEIIYFKLGTISQVTKDFFKLIYNLRKIKFDLVIDLEPFARFSEIVTYLTGANRTVGFKIFFLNRGFLYTDNIDLNDKQHITKLYSDLLKPLNIFTNDYTLEKIYINKEDKKYVDYILKDIKNKKIVCINVTSSNFAVARRWPKENFAELTDRIYKKYKPYLMFIGTEQDKGLISNIIGLMKSKAVINLAGKTNLKQLAGLIKRCDLVITNDTGPLHIATAMGTPTISFFGPETPVLYGPLGKKHTIFYKNLNCSPCISLLSNKEVRCHDMAPCIRSISVDEVFNKLGRYFEK